MAEDMTIGGITWHSSEEGGGPDVGVSVYLGGNQRLWIGEITSQLFDQSGRDHFNSDGGWFLVWYKPEPVLIAKCGDDLDAREFVEHLASLIYLSAQQREPVVRVAFDRFKDRIGKYIAQLNATGQVYAAHLLRRDVDCLRAALNGGRSDD